MAGLGFWDAASVFFTALLCSLCSGDPVWAFVLQARLLQISLQTIPEILGKVASLPPSVGKVW
ncbi:hypothetical protein I79_015976 [Cricetulus griseus]|uniref:Uncharacterized protein n=1 Tax=Cricetulus griseus TaxID=10029 RepID=G3HY58_CRIGR|nr:hypothetical protein I79_015976 [Cricetulus griseus]